MKTIFLIVFVYSVTSALAENDPDVDCSNWNNTDIKSMSYIGSHVKPNECKASNLCILKCCDRNEILYSDPSKNIIDECVNTSNLTDLPPLDYSIIKVYENDTDKPGNVSNMKWSDLHVLYHKNFKQCTENLREVAILSTNIVKYPEDLELKIQIVEDAYIVFKTFFFCVDLFVSKNGTTYSEPMASIHYLDLSADDDITGECDKFTGIIQNVSLVFLFLTFVAQIVLGQYKKMVDMLVITYIAMLFLQYLFKAIIVDMISCEILGLIYYFITISTIFWLNVISLNIWWTFRGFRLHRDIHRRGVLSKYKRYGLYAWGVPLVMTILVGVADKYVKENRFKPNFRDFCLFRNASDQIGGLAYYVHGPLAILITCNVVFFAMTLYNIRSAEFKGTSTAKTANHRFYTYAKLSLLMGVSWILEFCQEFYFPQCNWVYYFMNSYNGLIGVAIFFLITVPNLNLCSRFKRLPSRQESTVTTQMSSQSTQKNDSVKLRLEKSTTELESLHAPEVVTSHV